METKNFSTEQNEWLDSLAYWMIEYGVFNEQSLEKIRSKIDEDAYLEYFEEGFTPKQAVEEDLSYTD